VTRGIRICTRAAGAVDRGGSVDKDLPFFVVSWSVAPDVRLEDLMRPLTAALPVCLGVVLTLAAQGCGGSRVRDKDASVTVDPEPVDPTDPNTGATPPTGQPSPDPDPAGPAAPDGGPRPPGAPPRPSPDAAPLEPPPATCGGVTCPALFELVHPCRPTGSCMLNAVVPVPITFCYANGIKVVGESILPPNIVGLVKRADGTDCYRARIFQNAGSPASTVVWETPAGVPVATGVFDSAGNGTITCDNVTTPLTDPTCVAVPSPQGCMPGFCL
jgi:hypothetical protein